MESLTVGTFVGAGSFRCSSCGYVLALTGLDTLTACPSCGAPIPGEVIGLGGAPATPPG